MNVLRPGAVDLNLLVVLDAVLQERSVQRAAERLGLTPSAVSHALRRLREVADDPLVVRTARGVVPTPRAERAAPRLRSAVAEILHALDDEEAFDPRTARRTFTISSADFAQIVILPALEREIAATAPGVRLVIRPPRGDVFDGLAGGTLDLAFGIFGDAPEGIRYAPLFREEFRCAVRPNHPATGEPWTLERYLSLGHVVVAPRGGPGSIVDSALTRIGRAREVALVVPHFLVAPLVVAETDLVVTLPSRVAHRAAAMLPLATLPPPIDFGSFTVGQVWHERAHGDPAHAWLRRVIATIARGSAAPAEAERADTSSGG